MQHTKGNRIHKNTKNRLGKSKQAYRANYVPKNRQSAEGVVKTALGRKGRGRSNVGAWELSGTKNKEGVGTNWDV
jgi:hypothetical protein